MKENKGLIVIDGAQGEGGGQIFRTSLTLSMCLGQPVRIDNIRAGRNKPGLLRQHLVCLRAAREICDARVSEAEIGTSSVTFEPGAIRAGEYEFAIGSAGSTTLVFQTVLLPLLLADDVSELVLTGGTHNGMAPSYDFIAECYLPVLAAMGCSVDTELQAFGFYPAGGGAWRARIHPVVELAKLGLTEPGELIEQFALATSARIPGHIAERELKHVQKKCHWPEANLHRREVASVGPGNLISLRARHEHVTEVVEAFGERGLSAERVAGRAINAMNRYLVSGAAVGIYLADQLILPMALGQGGRIHTLEPSQHLLTNIDVVRRILGADIQVQKLDKRCWEITVRPQ